jgi:2-keto-4-pentenoate hydratase/2-oxohepta-3-ene-1,7-dioic acid hydratase in catechol pathway
MRIIRYQDAAGFIHHGCEHPDGSVTRLEGSPLDRLGDTGKGSLDSPLDRLGDTGKGSLDRPLDKLGDTGQKADLVKLLAPVDPRAIFGIGLNYRGHAKETGRELPESPVVFMKNPASVQHPGDPILLPACCEMGQEVDYECELAIVIGSPARNVPVDRALDHVLGYTAGHDVSARKWQKHSGAHQWIRGKSFDTFCPLGPAIVTKDEIPDPQTLSLSTTLNDNVMQKSHTSDMVFSCAELVSELSRDMTLLPGTVILTGTPEGVGFVRDPKVFLKPGDIVTIEVERIGKLTNPVKEA